MQEITYTLYIEYYDGKDWTIFKNLLEILNHRRRMAKHFPKLSFPKINQSENNEDQVMLEKRKYEVQGYINYLLKSKQAYRSFLEFIEYYKFGKNSYENPSPIGILEPDSSIDYVSITNQRAGMIKSGNMMSLNQEESIDIIGSLKGTEELLDKINNNKHHDDSDDEFYN